MLVTLTYIKNNGKSWRNDFARIKEISKGK